MSFNKIKSLVSSWKLDEALQQLSDDMMQSPQGKLLASTIYMQKGNYIRAIELAEAVLSSISESDVKNEGRARENIIYSLWWMGDLERLEPFVALTRNKVEYVYSVDEVTGQKWDLFLLNIEGLILWRNGQHRRALSEIEKALELSEDTSDIKNTALSLFTYSLIKYSQGAYLKSISAARRSLEIYRAIEYRIGEIYCISLLGISYYNMGDLQEALNIFEESMALHDEIGNKQLSAFVHDNIGSIYQSMGKFEVAETFLCSGLRMRREVGNDFEIAISLNNLIENALAEGDLERASKLVKELELISEINKNDHLYLQAALARVQVLRKEGSLSNMVLAKEILQRILRHEMIDFEVTMKSMVILCDILLLEFRIEEDLGKLEEIKAVLSTIEGIAERNQSFVLLIELLILRSKLSLLDTDVEKAKNYLEQASAIAEEHQLHGLLRKIESENEALLRQFKRWKSILDNSSWANRLEESNIIQYLDSLSRNKLTTNLPEQYTDLFR